MKPLLILLLLLSGCSDNKLKDVDAFSVCDQYARGQIESNYHMYLQGCLRGFIYAAIKLGKWNYNETTAR